MPEEKRGYDLHVHTTASDGVLSPEQVVDAAYRLKLTGIAITDHDTVAGIVPAIRHSKEHYSGFEVIPGIEMNTESGGYEVHILGYFIDDKNQAMLKHLADIRNARYERARKMVLKLRSMGLQVTFERVQQYAGSDLIGRPHVARAMIDRGYVFSVKEAFEKYIGKGKPAYIPRYKFTPDTAIQLIKGAGGIPVLAHPGLLKNDVIVEQVIDMGIAGIEAYYPEHSEMDIKKYIEICSRRNLTITGGSDFHDPDEKISSSMLGAVTVDNRMVADLKQWILSENSEN